MKIIDYLRDKIGKSFFSPFYSEVTVYDVKDDSIIVWAGKSKSFLLKLDEYGVYKPLGDVVIFPWGQDWEEILKEEVERNDV